MGWQPKSVLGSHPITIYVAFALRSEAALKHHGERLMLEMLPWILRSERLDLDSSRYSARSAGIYHIAVEIADLKLKLELSHITACTHF